MSSKVIHNLISGNPTEETASLSKANLRSRINVSGQDPVEFLEQVLDINPPPSEDDRPLHFVPRGHHVHSVLLQDCGRGWLPEERLPHGIVRTARGRCVAAGDEEVRGEEEFQETRGVLCGLFGAVLGEHQLCWVSVRPLWGFSLQAHASRFMILFNVCYPILYSTFLCFSR